MTILRRIDRMLERFLGIMDGIASVSIFVIMILITADVLSRLIFNKPFVGTAEIVSSIIIIVAFWRFLMWRLREPMFGPLCFMTRSGRRGSL